MVLGGGRDDHLRAVLEQAGTALADGNVVVRTTRTLVTGADGEASFHIARTVSGAVVEVVQRILAARPLRFVVVGIMSSDVASRGLGITRPPSSAARCCRGSSRYGSPARVLPAASPTSSSPGTCATTSRWPTSSTLTA